ncbi:CYTH domain-containing protein [Marinococcus halophilus]|uniref:Putative triphosphatase YjbK n=1 Tax=Marinococcus halophilus TaxID=1371 RepID=A0A510Y705_MARHA|nr:CYTH domain-containing protein [Marinococcus halophilus]OZT79541.1 CYTH domain-containing protein [Marinococcus halophilus]GEK59149.1 putative triphosphatase YjbK [Marinococcus halophilus]
MAKEQEIEAKNLLTEKEFSSLVTGFAIHESDFSSQQNTYFDTKSFALRSRKSALRIRERAGTFTLTLKEPAPEGLTEWNQSVSAQNAREAISGGTLPAGEVSERLRSLIGAERVENIGTLTTYRASQPFRTGEIFFDRSHYLGVTDYELEIEGPSEKDVSSWMNELSEQHHFPLRNTPNKIERLFQRNREQNEEQ